MAERMALIFETNAVLNERYLLYLQDSGWRVLFKDTMNSFLEKLQDDRFDLIVAEADLLPDGIVKMIASIGTPLILSSNDTIDGVETIKRNFNKDELLAAFNKLVPPEDEEESDEEGVLPEQFADLEDTDSGDEAVFDLNKKNKLEEFTLTPHIEPSGNGGGDETFPEDVTLKQNIEPTSLVNDEEEEPLEEFTLKQHIEPSAPEENDDSTLFGDSAGGFTVTPEESSFAAPPSDDSESENGPSIKSLLDSLNIKKGGKKESKEMPEEDLIENSPLLNDNLEEGASEDNGAELFSEIHNLHKQEQPQGNQQAAPAGDDETMKKYVFEWLDKNARAVIKETVLEQLEEITKK